MTYTVRGNLLWAGREEGLIERGWKTGKRILKNERDLWAESRKSVIERPL